MENFKKHLSKRHVMILVFFGVILAISFSAVSTSTSYLYRSRADDNPDIFHIEQDSVAIATIDTRAYSCINNLTYLPDEQENGCFAQFECKQGVIAKISGECSQKNDTISCTASTSQCLSRQEWIERARSACGC